jgi:hypothetical protein
MRAAALSAFLLLSACAGRPLPEVPPPDPGPEGPECGRAGRDCCVLTCREGSCPPATCDWGLLCVRAETAWAGGAPTEWRQFCVDPAAAR